MRVPSLRIVFFGLAVHPREQRRLALLALVSLLEAVISKTLCRVEPLNVKHS
jgi:hypothetical protein